MTDATGPRPGSRYRGDFSMTNEELKHLEQEKSHKERDARMKYGKRYKDVLKRQKEAKDKLHHETRTKGVRFLR